MSEARDELADVVSSGGEDFGAFAASRWPELVRQAYELTGDQAAAADLAQAALTRTSLAWWRVSRAGDPDEAVRRVLLRASRRKYAAFFVPGALRIFWLNWIDASGRPIAGFTGLPGYGYMQFSPDGVAD